MILYVKHLHGLHALKIHCIEYTDMELVLHMHNTFLKFTHRLAKCMKYICMGRELIIHFGEMHLLEYVYVDKLVMFKLLNIDKEIYKLHCILTHLFYWIIFAIHAILYYHSLHSIRIMKYMSCVLCINEIHSLSYILLYSNCCSLMFCNIVIEKHWLKRIVCQRLVMRTVYLSSTIIHRDRHAALVKTDLRYTHATHSKQTSSSQRKNRKGLFNNVKDYFMLYSS